MNTPSPLLPQGTTPPRSKSSIYFKVLMILTVHVVVIGGMLLQGCKDTSTAKSDLANNANNTQTSSSDTTAANTQTADNSSGPGASISQPLPNQASLSNAVTAQTPAPAALAPTPTSPPQVTPTPTSPTLMPTPAASAGESKEYTVARGDTLGRIAHRNGISLKALMDANPNVNPKRLQIGQKLQIPAGMAAAPAASGAGATDAIAATDDGSVYVVKSGDMLLRIAHSHGTTVKRIMALNDLRSTSIRVGQKLKMPAPKAAPLDNTAAPAASVMQPPTASAPVSVSASAAGAPASTAAN